ncbi:MAG: hypothetical protein MHM6MM_008399, partial [Cercozoa sp. M6MM]
MDEGRHWMSQDMSPHQPRDKRRPRRRSRIITAGDEEGAAGANHQSEKLGALRPKEAKRMLARKLRSWTPVAGTCIYALDDSSGCMWPAMLLGIVGTRAYFRWINPSDGVLYADPTSVRLSDIEKFPEYGVLDQYDALSDPDDCIEFDENELEVSLLLLLLFVVVVVVVVVLLCHPNDCRTSGSASSCRRKRWKHSPRSCRISCKNTREYHVPPCPASFGNNATRRPLSGFVKIPTGGVLRVPGVTEPLATLSFTSTKKSSSSARM